MLRFSPRYAYIPKDINAPSYTATQLRLQICLCSFKLRYNIKRYAFNPMSSYAYVPRYAATNYVPRYAYAPKDTVTFQASQLLSYAYTLQDTFRLRYNQKVRFQSGVKLRLRSKICSYGYVSKYILTKSLLNPSRFPSPRSFRLSLWITLQGPPVNICLAENTVQNFFTIHKFRWALGISLQHFKFN